MTLAEACIALTITGIMTALAAPAARHGIAVAQVRAAREAVFGAASRARAAALAQGGADLVIDTNDKTAAVVGGSGAVIYSLALSAYGVDVAMDGAAVRVVLRYDGHGIGRMTSRTLRFQRGRAEAGLTVSAYGRVRRW